MTPDNVVTDHGLTVTLPGSHQGIVYTDSRSDSQQFAHMLQHCGCQIELFDYDPEPVNRTWSA